MSRPNLAQLLAESARNVEQERTDKKQVERITAAVKAQLAKRAETSKPMSCPRCGEPLPESWRPSEETNGTGQDDPDNEQDDVGTYDNRQTVRPLSGLSRDQVVASLNKIRC